MNLYLRIFVVVLSPSDFLSTSLSLPSLTPSLLVCYLIFIYIHLYSLPTVLSVSLPCFLSSLPFHPFAMFIPFCSCFLYSLISAATFSSHYFYPSSFRLFFPRSLFHRSSYTIFLPTLFSILIPWSSFVPSLLSFFPIPLPLFIYLFRTPFFTPFVLPTLLPVFLSSLLHPSSTTVLSTFLSFYFRTLLSHLSFSFLQLCLSSVHPIYLSSSFHFITHFLPFFLSSFLAPLSLFPLLFCSFLSSPNANFYFSIFLSTISSFFLLFLISCFLSPFSYRFIIPSLFPTLHPFFSYLYLIAFSSKYLY